MTVDTALMDGELQLTGRIRSASNATFIGHIGDVEVVYKPVAGERPLWDFPNGSLAHREVAAHLVSQAFGGNIVPPTWLRDGPLGVGMVQLWRESDPQQSAVTLVPASDVPHEGWCHVFDGLDAQDHPVSLIHEDSPALRRMAVLDILINNADRKGGHVLEMLDGHRHGVDHGVTFHVEHKLRTVLWGWIDHDLVDAELAGVEEVRSAMTGGLAESLAPLLTEAEIAAVSARCEQLLREARFPAPRGDMPAIPWPPF